RGIDIDDDANVLVLAPNSMPALAQGFTRYEPATSTRNVLLTFNDTTSRLSSLVAISKEGFAIGDGSDGTAARGVVCAGGCGVLPARGGRALNQSHAAAVNDLGSVVGTSDAAPGPAPDPTLQHAFLVDDSLQITDLGTLGGTQSSAVAVAPSTDTVV